MKAAVYEKYGPPEVVRIAEVETPTPGSGEVRIRVHATTVSSGDWRMRSKELPKGFGLVGAIMFGRRPKQQVLGSECSGIIDAVGDGVTQWRIGEEVFAFPGMKLGAHAEYVCLPAAGRIARKPGNLSFEEAAALSFGGSTCIHFIEKGGGIRQGEQVLVVGAAGGVGSAMVQLAAHYGGEVTGVCSTRNVDVVRDLGASHVIDYTAQTLTDAGRAYDVIMDTAGRAPIKTAKPLLNPGGRMLMVYAGFGDMLRSMFSRRIVAGPAKEDPKHLPVLAQLAEQGHFKPLIGEVFPFEQIVEAHRLVDTGHKRGSVVVKVT